MARSDELHFGPATGADNRENWTAVPVSTIVVAGVQRPRAGTYTNFRCGHQRVDTVVKPEKEKENLEIDDLGFVVYQSDDDCPGCKNKDLFPDDLSHKFSFGTKSSRPNTFASMSPPTHENDKPQTHLGAFDISQWETDPAARPKPRTYQPMRIIDENTSRKAVKLTRSDDEQFALSQRTASSLDPPLEMQPLISKKQREEQDLKEMMYSSTMDLAPESEKPKRKHSKRERVKELGRSIWESFPGHR